MIPGIFVVVVQQIETSFHVLIAQFLISQISLGNFPILAESQYNVLTRSGF